jgi:hypothetical protein
MAARTVATTDTLEDLRTTFNALSSTDFGDKATLAGGISATTLVGAVNEIFATAAAAGGYIMSDGSNTQTVDSGQTVTFAGTSNEIEVAVSATDTLTIGLPSAVAITTSLTIGGVAVPTISSTSTLTNKTLTSPKINEDVAVTSTATELNLIDGSAAGTIANSKAVIYGSSGEVNATTLQIAGSSITSTAAELNIVDGDTSAGTTAVAGSDGIVTNDAGTMRQTTVDTFDTYLAGTTKTLTNKTLTTPTLTTPIINAGGQLKNGATSAGFLEFFEDSDNGTNKVTLIGPASTADITITLPTQAGTVVVSNTDDGNDVQLDSLGLNTAASGTAGELRATDDITAFYSSDVALKENIHNISSASEKIEQLNGVLFDWKQDFIDSKGGEDGYFVRKTDVGVIAQEVEKVLPEIVATRQNGVKAVKYDRLVALLIEGFKEMKQEIKNLKKKTV